VLNLDIPFDVNLDDDDDDNDDDDADDDDDDDNGDGYSNAVDDHTFDKALQRLVSGIFFYLSL